jgi:hypothetical protein
MQRGGDLAAEGSLAAVGLASDQTDPAQLQKVIQLRLRLLLDGGAEVNTGFSPRAVSQP